MTFTNLTNANYIDVLNCKCINLSKTSNAEFRTCLNRDVVRSIVLSDITSAPIISASLSGTYFSWYYIASSEPVASAIYLDNKCNFICCDDLVHGTGANIIRSASRISDGFTNHNASSVIIGANFGLYDTKPKADILASFSRLYQSCTEINLRIADIILTERLDYLSLLDYFS